MLTVEHRRPAMSDPPLFKWRRFEAAIILCAVQQYLRYALSYRDVEELMRERGLAVDHTTIFHQGLQASHARTPNMITVDKNAADPHAFEALQKDGMLPSPCVFRQCKYLNNVMEQDHRFVKRRVNPGLGFGAFHTAHWTIQGYEAMHMLRKGQIEGLAKGDGLAQNQVINRMFGVAA
jgi:transposase-like protein